MSSTTRSGWFFSASSTALLPLMAVSIDRAGRLEGGLHAGQDVVDRHRPAEFFCLAGIHSWECLLRGGANDQVSDRPQILSRNRPPPESNQDHQGPSPISQLYACDRPRDGPSASLTGFYCGTASLSVAGACVGANLVFVLIPSRMMQGEHKVRPYKFADSAPSYRRANTRFAPTEHALFISHRRAGQRFGRADSGPRPCDRNCLTRTLFILGILLACLMDRRLPQPSPASSSRLSDFCFRASPSTW